MPVQCHCWRALKEVGSLLADVWGGGGQTGVSSTICQPDDSHTFGRTFGGRPAREATDRRAQREPPWRQKFKLPPLRAERRRYLALVWENYGTRPTRCSRHPGDVPVGLDPQLSMSKKNDGRNPAVNTAETHTELRCRTPELLVRLRRKELHCYNFIGNNDSLMNVLGCSPIMHGAVTHTAGILGLKKKKHEDCCCCYDVFFVRGQTTRMDGMKWHQDTALPTTFSKPHAKRACLFASALSILVQPTLSMMMDGWMDGFRHGHGRATISPRNTAAAAQFDEGM